MPRRQLAVVSVCFTLLTLSCGGVSEPPPTPVKQAIALRAPAYKWVPFYGGLLPRASLDEEQTALIARLTGAPDTPLCPLLESRVVGAATAYAGELAASPDWRPREHTDRLRFHLQRFGTTDYSVDSVVGRLDCTGEAKLEEFIATRSSEWTHCGVGFASGRAGKIAVVIGLRRQVEINPIPVRIAPHSSFELLGKLQAGPEAPLQALLGAPNGSVTIAKVRSIGGNAFRAIFATADTGRYQVELLADLGNGAETVILLPVYVGIEPPKRPVILADTELDPSAGDPAEMLLNLLNAKRAQMGIRKLVASPRLQAEALKHSTDMADDGFFGHVSPTNGSLGRRLKRGRIRSQKAAENIARSYSIIRIHHNLLQSPSHRLNALDPDMSHVGIGVIQSPDGYLATEIFAKW